MATIYQGPRGAQLQFATGAAGAGGMGGRMGMGGSDRGSEINWAVSRLTGDEARGKVALLTEELKQMKLMNTEIKLVKDALRRQQKELRQLENEGDTLQQEVQSEKARRLELARMLEQAKQSNPLLDPEEYPLTDADLEDKPLRATDEDEAAAAAAAEEVDAEMQEAAAAGMMGGAPAAGQGDRVMDDLLSLLMSNTAAGAELGLTSEQAPAPAAVFAGAAMPIATAGGEAVEVRSPGEQQQQQQQQQNAQPPPLLSAASPVLLGQSAAAPAVSIDGALSPHGSAIPQDLFKSSEAWTKPSPAPAPAPAPASAPAPAPASAPAPAPPKPEPEPEPPAQPPPHPSQINDEDGAI